MKDVVGGKSARSEKELRGHRCNDGLHKEDKMGRVSQEAKRSDKWWGRENAGQQSLAALPTYL